MRQAECQWKQGRKTGRQLESCHFVGLSGMSDLHSVLWRCWLGGRKGIRPVKNWVVGCCMVICLERGADLHVAQLMPLPLTVSCFSKIQISFTFLVPAHPGSPGQRAFNGSVCVCVLLNHSPCLNHSHPGLKFSGRRMSRGLYNCHLCHLNTMQKSTNSVPAWQVHHGTMQFKTDIQDRNWNSDDDIQSLFTAMCLPAQLWQQNFCSCRTSPVELSSSQAA